MKNTTQTHNNGTSIQEKLQKKSILVSDGAWGTFFFKKGLSSGQAPELWCLERPDDVYDIASEYVKAGTDLIGTNSFGASSLKLEHYGAADKAADINEAAAAISRRAADEAPNRKVSVIGSVGPTGKILMMGEVTEQQMYDSFAEQVTALEKGGADAICVETMSALDEAQCAIKAARDNTNCEIICTFTFEKTVQGDFKTMMGLGPEAMLSSIVESGADIVGTNCGNGMEQMADIVSTIRAINPDIPILVHANAGLPQQKDGKVVFPESPAEMAALTRNVIQSGANIVGGCCGTTPEHIREIKRIVDSI